MFTNGMHFGNGCARSFRAPFYADSTGIIMSMDTILVSIFIAIAGIIRPVLVSSTGDHRAISQ